MLFRSRGRTDQDRDRRPDTRHPDGRLDDHGADRGRDRDRHHSDGGDRSWGHDAWGHDSGGRAFGDHNRDWQWRDQQPRDWQWRDNNSAYRDWGGSRRPYYSPHRYRGWTYRAPYGFYDHNWRYGEYLPQAWWAPNYKITDWWNFGLPRAPIGYQWVRVGDDAFLVDRFNGRVIQIVYDLFW